MAKRCAHSATNIQRGTMHFKELDLRFVAMLWVVGDPCWRQMWQTCTQATRSPLEKRNAERRRNCRSRKGEKCQIESSMIQEKTDEKRLEMENERLAFDRERAAADDARYRAVQSNVDCRLEVVEGRLGLESSARSGRIELDHPALQLANKERRAMIDLLKNLANT